MDTLIKTENSLEAWLANLPARASEHHRRTGRPFVTLSYAQSLDGCITVRRGQPLALSGPLSMRLTHRLRALHNAILVGIGTVLADDPQLSVRLVPGSSPRPVVLDSQLRFPASARLLDRDDNFPWIFCAQSAAPGRQAELTRRGAQILPVAVDADGHLNLGEVLARLGEAGMTSLMVEGGARVISRFLAGMLVDEAVITTAPIWLGGLSAVECELGGPAGFPALVEPGFSQLGKDLVSWGRLSWREKGAGG